MKRIIQVKYVTSVWFEKEDEELAVTMRDCGIRQLSENTSISPSMISRWIKGQTGMRLEKVDKILRVLKCDKKNKALITRYHAKLVFGTNKSVRSQ